MNRLIASLLIVAIAGVFAKISPSSQADISIADFADLQQLDALVNSDFGVISGTSPQGLKLGSFSIGSDFELNSVAYIDAYCTGASQLINAGDNVDEFLLFCSSNSSVVFLTIDINDSNGNMTVTNSSEYDPNGVAMISASAFVTKQGNVYMSDSSDGMISIVEFHVADGTFVTRFENILEDYEGDWYIQDLHSLPYDAGVSVILNSNDNSTQMFLSCYFNGTTFDNTIPEGQVLQYVGRHRGSNFGYTIGVQSPYTIVTAWDLSDRSISNSVQIKGELLQRNDGHFSTNEMVFVYSEADGSGYIYELPYSERGFLPNSVNFEEVDAFGDGNLADGQDGTHIYSFTASDSGDAQLSRWLF